MPPSSKHHGIVHIIKPSYYMPCFVVGYSFMKPKENIWYRNLTLDYTKALKKHQPHVLLAFLTYKKNEVLPCMWHIFFFLPDSLSAQWHVIPKGHVAPCFLMSHSSMKFIICMYYSLFVLGSLRAEGPVFILPSYGMCFGYKMCSLNHSGIFHSFVNLRRGKMRRCPLASSSLACFFCGFQGKNVKIDQEIWWQVSFQLQLHALSC